MNKFDYEFETSLEQTIASIEEKTSVEIVVAITPRSDSYVDAYWKGGLIFFLVMLLFILYSPVVFPEAWIPLELTFSFLFGAAAVHFLSPFRRLLVSAKRKAHYVDSASYRFFMEHRLNDTIERTALLIYISTLEKRCRLIADKGVLEALPAGVWKEIENQFNGLFNSPGALLPQAILEVLPTIEPPLAEHLPPAEENIDELSNRLRRIEK